MHSVRKAITASKSLIFVWMCLHCGNCCGQLVTFDAIQQVSKFWLWINELVPIYLLILKDNMVLGMLRHILFPATCLFPSYVDIHCGPITIIAWWMTTGLFLTSTCCGLWNTVFLVSGSDKLNYNFHNLAYYIRNSGAMAIVCPDLSWARNYSKTMKFIII